MADQVVLVSNQVPGGIPYDFGPSHPMQPVRIQLMFELMRACGLLEAPGVTVIEPRHATRDELQAIHAPDYLDAVERLSGDTLSGRERIRLQTTYGFHSSDNPSFPGLHAAAALIAGGAVRAAEMVMSGKARHAFIPGGGLHHAHRARAAGFCVYNDPAIAIAAIRASTGARVAYIDVDVHHGDGVQELFYSDPNVLTISLHESGHYLFPGTGFVHELGDGPGYGYSINVPLEPYSGDAALMQVLHEVIVPLVSAYSPDLIVTQCGCDTHWLDPMAHLVGTTRIWPEIARTFHLLAHEVCDGRWIATGGGGYDLYSVVPRAWTLLFAGMIEVVLPERLPDAFLEKRKRLTTQQMVDTFLDNLTVPIRGELQQSALERAADTIATVRALPLPFLRPAPG